MGAAAGSEREDRTRESRFAPRVKALIPWKGKQLPIEGTLAGAFIVAAGEVQVRLDDVDPIPPGWDSRTLWVAAGCLVEPVPLVLRSELWELPSTGERHYVLRTLSVTVGDLVKEHGLKVELGRLWPGYMELAVSLAIPLTTVNHYMAALLPVRRRCQPRPAPWPRLQGAKTALLDGSTRANAGYQVSQLPAWLDSNQFWSVLSWDEGELVHTLQFTLPERLRRTIESRFKL